VIGDTVNTAQRLQDFATPGQILITQASFELVKEAFQCREVGKESLRNKAIPVHIYEVLE